MAAARVAAGHADTSIDYGAFAEAIERDLSEARQLVIAGHSEMGLVRSVASFEWFVKRAFLEPYLQMVAVSLTGELAKLMMNTLRRPNGWRNEVPRLLDAFWEIDTDDMPAWKTYLTIWDLRNEIVHDGGRCDAHQAERGIDTCEVVLKTLLVNRIDARRRGI
jgi:hypothetical protein